MQPKEDIPSAQADADAITRLKDRDLSALTAAGIPGPELLELARQLVIGRIALAGNKLEDARATFEHAASIYDALPYSEPPHWYYPVRQSLGAVLLRLGKSRGRGRRVPGHPGAGTQQWLGACLAWARCIVAWAATKPPPR